MDSDFSNLQMKKWKARSQNYLGLHLGGAKNDKTLICEIQYYPKYKQLALTSIREKIGPSTECSGDKSLLAELKKTKTIKALGVNSSIQMPACYRCRLKCPGIEKCRVEEVVWLKKEYQKNLKKNKKSKMAMPYTDRAMEYYINTYLEKHIDTQYSLSANAAPLSARMFYLNKHLKMDLYEVLPSLSVWRIGRFLNVQKSYLKYYKNSDDCEVVRLFFLDQLKEKIPLFMYNQDKQKLVSNPNAFDAFICALTVFLEGKGFSEPRPKSFPKKAAWLSFPSEDLEDAFG